MTRGRDEAPIVRSIVRGLFWTVAALALPAALVAGQALCLALTGGTS